MKKLFKYISIIITLITPVVATISCGQEEHVGPRGGHYTISPGGNKKYHGHYSNYHTHSNTE